MTKQLIIVGGGGHARVLMETAVAAGLKVKGYVAPEKAQIDFVPYLGGDTVLEQGDRQDVQLLIGVGSIKPTRLRAQLYERFTAMGYTFATLVHPSAIIVAGARLNPGAQIIAGAVIQCGVEVGENVIVNTGATIDHDSRIGAHTHVAPGVTICGDVVVGARVHIGAGAVLVQGSKVADDSLVKAGEVVVAAKSSGSPHD